MTSPLRHRRVTSALALCAALAATSGGAAAATPASIPADLPGYVRACSVVVPVEQAGAENDTPLFVEAMRVALLEAPTCYPAGPTGAPQAVVYVPPGTYELADFRFNDNVRIEVDAAAVLRPPANRLTTAPTVWTPMMYMDRDPDRGPLRNVTLIGVGKSYESLKQTAVREGQGLVPADRVKGSFTIDLDPERTGSTNYATGLNIVNVEGFLVKNLFTVQNDTLQLDAPVTTWPTTSRAAMQLYAHKESPIGGPYYRPTLGTVSNHTNLHGPRGYGPNQVNAADRVLFSGIRSIGGTALRLETDGSAQRDGTPKRGSRIDDLRAQDIRGVRCNRGLSLSPHGQVNGDVHVTSVRTIGCGQSVIGNTDPEILPQYVGSFGKVTIDFVRSTGAAGAQLDATDGYLWQVGVSRMPAFAAPEMTWGYCIAKISGKGHFTDTLPGSYGNFDGRTPHHRSCS